MPEKYLYYHNIVVLHSANYYLSTSCEFITSLRKIGQIVQQLGYQGDSRGTRSIQEFDEKTFSLATTLKTEK
jgi:hypothetical protein